MAPPARLSERNGSTDGDMKKERGAASAVGPGWLAEGIPRTAARRGVRAAADAPIWESSPARATRWLGLRVTFLSPFARVAGLGHQGGHGVYCNLAGCPQPMGDLLCDESHVTCILGRNASQEAAFVRGRPSR